MKKIKLLKFATPILALSSITFPISFISACSKTPTFATNFETLKCLAMDSDSDIVFGDAIHDYSIGTYELVATTANDKSPTGRYSLNNSFSRSQNVFFFSATSGGEGGKGTTIIYFKRIPTYSSMSITCWGTNDEVDINTTDLSTVSWNKIIIDAMWTNPSMDSLFITNVDDDYLINTGATVNINDNVKCYDTTGALRDNIMYSTSGSLPEGLTLNANTGAITGTLTAPAGTYGYTLKAISPTQQAGSVLCKIMIYDE